jgi:hypothetical protein
MKGLTVTQKSWIVEVTEQEVVRFLSSPDHLPFVVPAGATIEVRDGFTLRWVESRICEDVVGSDE